MRQRRYGEQRRTVSQELRAAELDLIRAERGLSSVETREADRLAQRAYMREYMREYRATR